MALSSMSYFADLDRLRSYSRHNNHHTPKSMQDVWKTSYQNSFNGKKIGYNPDRVVADYFSGSRSVMQNRQSRERERFRTSLNERAREGFRYWMIDKTKTPQFGKYGTGAYKSVLGIGNAPRS